MSFDEFLENVVLALLEDLGWCRYDPTEDEDEFPALCSYDDDSYYYY